MVGVCGQCHEESSGDGEGLRCTCHKDDYEPQCYFDSLPDELLVKVLSMVPTMDVRQFKALLALRLVSRRFNEALARPAVWRHRSLLVQWASDVHVLRSVPVLDHVDVSLHLAKGRMSHSRIEYDKRQETLEGLVWTRTKVRSMKLNYGISDPISRLTLKLLKYRRTTLEKLNFRLQRAINSHPWPILEALNGMKNLKTLILGPLVRQKRVTTELCWDEMPQPAYLDNFGSNRRPFPLPNLNSLERLVVVTKVSHTLVTSLLEASKDSLQVVKCPLYDIAVELAACSLLREADVMASKALPRLLDLSNLQAVTIRCTASQLSWLIKFLDSPKPQPPIIHVHLTEMDSCETFKQVAPSLHRVCFLRLVGKGRLRLRDARNFPVCLAGMDALEELHLDGFLDECVMFMLKEMDVSVVPNLKRLVVSSGVRWELLMNETLPQLTIVGK